MFKAIEQIQVQGDDSRAMSKAMVNKFKYKRNVP